MGKSPDPLNHAFFVAIIATAWEKNIRNNYAPNIDSG
jgi:hypothetical protein